MTSRERIIAAGRLEPVDRVPVSPFGLGSLDPDGPVARELIEKTDPFLTAGLGSPFLGSSVSADTIVEGEVTTTVYHTPKGDLVHRRQRTEVTSATVQFPLKTAADIECLLSIPFTAASPDPSAFLRLKTAVGEEAMVLAAIGTAVCLPATWFSPEDFSLLWADAPDLMVDLVEVASSRLNDFVARACRRGVTDYRLVGGEYITTQLGPSAVPSLLQGPDGTLVDIIHRHGGLAYYHNHGPMMRFLADLVPVGMDYLDPLEGPPFADTDLRLARGILGDRVCMVGNLDDMEVLEQWSPAQVQAAAQARLTAAGSRGFCLGGTASGTYGETAARNFIAMVDTAAAFGWQD